MSKRAEPTKTDVPEISVEFRPVDDRPFRLVSTSSEGDFEERVEIALTAQEAERFGGILWANGSSARKRGSWWRSRS